MRKWHALDLRIPDASLVFHHLPGEDNDDLLREDGFRVYLSDLSVL